jgi:hypothetical protein
MNFVIEKILRPNPCILTKKLIVFPFCANEHWTTTLVTKRVIFVDQSLPADLRILSTPFFVSLYPCITRMTVCSHWHNHNADAFFSACGSSCSAPFFAVAQLNITTAGWFVMDEHVSVWREIRFLINSIKNVNFVRQSWLSKLTHNFVIQFWGRPLLDLGWEHGPLTLAFTTQGRYSTSMTTRVLQYAGLNWIKATVVTTGNPPLWGGMA